MCLLMVLVNVVLVLEMGLVIEEEEKVRESMVCAKKTENRKKATAAMVIHNEIGAMRPDADEDDGLKDICMPTFLLSWVKVLLLWM